MKKQLSFSLLLSLVQYYPSPQAAVRKLNHLKTRSSEILARAEGG